MSEQAKEAGRLRAGEVMPDFTYDSPFERNRTLSAAMEGKPAALLFLRYYGCTVCQLDLQIYADEYGVIEGSGGQLKIVLQSDPALVARELQTPGARPYEIICDPEQVLYKRFAIPAAADKEELRGGDNGMEKIMEARKSHSHGEYEGEELQLPACFVLAPDRTVTWAHYGKHIADIPEPERLAELLGQ